MNHDLMRGIKGGQPFYLMEQTPSVTDWLPYNALKRPGGMGLLIWQAVAHGDSVLFFQMRRSIGACEKYHGALMDHAGMSIHGCSGKCRPWVQRGTVRCCPGARTAAKAAIVVDWDNWWALEYSGRAQL